MLEQAGLGYCVALARLSGSPIPSIRAIIQWLRGLKSTINVWHKCHILMLAILSAMRYLQTSDPLVDCTGRRHPTAFRSGCLILLHPPKRVILFDRMARLVYIYGDHVGPFCISSV